MLRLEFLCIFRYKIAEAPTLQRILFHLSEGERVAQDFSVRLVIRLIGRIERSVYSCKPDQLIGMDVTLAITSTSPIVCQDLQFNAAFQRYHFILKCRDNRLNVDLCHAALAPYSCSETSRRYERDTLSYLIYNEPTRLTNGRLLRYLH